jgi:hypothetical protein
MIRIIKAKVVEISGVCSTHGGFDDKCIQILVEKHEGERPLGRPE